MKGGRRTRKKRRESKRVKGPDEGSREEREGPRKKKTRSENRAGGAGERRKGIDNTNERLLAGRVQALSRDRTSEGEWREQADPSLFLEKGGSRREQVVQECYTGKQTKEGAVG